ncbi:response regulator [Pelagicoccus enzymogenes]|uniref:response regulator n=1 Tax=Pelagicoccus enzymogenes TaxID=2773457 RepID=UPI00281092EB|nr:response regulator [Pelagicoccus enzymogenes]MDQ8200256.1 response regulator [Pelagicoccus enzymogenes]
MAKTVISIDDSLSVRETVRMTLASQGYQVALAEDGVKGLALCQQRKADLVITDLNMPNMDGINLIAKLRQLPEYRFTPILMLTTESQDQKKMAGKKAGATGWIVKPFKPEKFLAVVNKVCPNN